MFFQGSLQEGIQTALQQSKFVVCFVTDGEDESEKWENEFLTDESIEPLLSARAVTLRLESGSQEEGYLAQIYPLPKKPTVVIIKDAGLKEYIAAGTTREDFLGRLAKALLADVIAPQAQAEASSSEPASSAAANSAQALATSSTPAPAPSPSPATTQSQNQSQNQSTIQAVLAERAARLEAQRKKEAEEAKRQRAEKGKGKATAGEPGGSSEPTDSQSKHAEQLRKKQREAREERQRILKAIEDDKAARRAQKAERDAEKKRAAEGHSAAEDGGGGPLPFAPASQLLPSTGRLPSESCSLQVRLFDGSTIRGRFTGRDTLRVDVREWVDAMRKDGGAPFTFKVVLTPLPNRTIDVTEEDKSLAELGLTPSSTLILIPVPKSSSAYAAVAGTQGGGNVVSRFFAYILALITGFYTLVVSFFSAMFSTAGPPPAPAAAAPATRQGQQQQQSRAQASGRDGGQVKGLRTNDKEKKRNDQQFYNGNSTNFEPRRDEDEDED